jgi:23S rRNA pseudouridine2605 synthase
MEVAHRHSYLILNKPADCVTTRAENNGRERKTVYSYLADVPADILSSLNFVGRLDMRTEGLLLFTDDGFLNQAMTNSSGQSNQSAGNEEKVEKVYHVQVASTLDKCAAPGTVTEGQLRQMEEPMKIGKAMTEPAKVHVCHPPSTSSFIQTKQEATVDKEKAEKKEEQAVGCLQETADSSWVEVVIHQGKKWQVRRLCGRSRLTVLRLRRVKFGPLTLDGLKEGEWRALTQLEVSACYELAAPAGHARPDVCDIPRTVGDRASDASSVESVVVVGGTGGEVVEEAGEAGGMKRKRTADGLEAGPAVRVAGGAGVAGKHNAPPLTRTIYTRTHTLRTPNTAHV